MILGMTGAHWLMLQSVAWTNMVIDYSRTSSLKTAIEQTFDGQHPCKLCKLIQKARQSSPQQQLQQPVAKHDDVSTVAPALLFPDAPGFRFAATAEILLPSRTDPPPVPPPRPFAGRT